MSEDGGWAQPNGFLPNGLLPREAVDVTRALDAERWAVAEERTAELIACIQPNQLSEERRNAVANYVQRLIMKCFSCQVCTFGSVPLKTYLPDGDIDLTAFSKNENLKDTWASTVRDMLENEEKSETAEYHVKEVQYIQAEVKIIKCLVENIVVDISFNQVGGLCTLCFLDEIDHLINQNHLFKRSIILIKAWCYYESRILGAHHGLISTYALETLVLYIFHVFNNSFAGPLEVLYRFLEFFGNFDWENFCVSLWGPVPISSLPEMTAEPPRKDGGELLLSKLFLNLCSTIYAVFPSGQESQSQPFVSKHFNVIDPLRTNNNLGRSVSKGNFYRIRSAFTFGAKRLDRLLECPKENLIAEVNKFFTNTWERHGSGYRPDAPGPTFGHLSPLKSVPVESNKSRSSTSIKKKSHTVGLTAGHEQHVEGNFAFQGSTSQLFNAISQHSQTTGRASNFPAVPYAQKNYGVRTHSGISDRFERGSSSGSCTPVDKSQKSLRPDNSVNDREGQTRFQFARTQSSPELTDTSAEVKFKARHNRVVKTGKEQTSPARSDYVSRRKNTGSEVPIDPHAISSLGDPSLRQISSHQSLEVASHSHTVSKSHCDNASFASIGEEHNSASESLEMQKEMNQEEQDLVNMMAFSRIHNFNGQVQFPMHLASSHLPLSSSPVLASIGYAQRNMAGLIPTNFPLVDPSWGLNVQFPQGPFSSPLPHYFPSSIQDASPDDLIESGNESSGMTDLNLDDPKHSFWQENDGATGRGFDLENGVPQAHHFDEKQLSTSGSNNLVSSSRANSSTASSMDGHKFGSENREAARGDTGTSQYQSRRVNDFHSVDRNGNMGSFHVSQASSVRNKWGFANPRDSSPSRVSKSPRDKWGRKPVSSVVRSSLDVRARSGWQGEGSSDDVSAQEGNDSREWVALSTRDSDLVNRATGSASSAVSHPRSHQLSGYEQPQISGSDSVIPSAPILVGSSQQRAVDNPDVVPLTFYPTGPPVPFITMLPVYNFPSDAGNSNASSSQFARDDVDHSHVNQSDQNFDSKESIDQSEGRMSLTASTLEGLKSDILNSDFASHWQNLQYGRFCQNERVHGPLIYPSVMVPPIYFQGHFPLEGPGRPLSTNVNVFSQMMGHGPRLVPVAPLQPGPLRPSGVFHRYGDDAAPRFRGGTGTYLPNPKVAYRDRHYSNSRSHRGSYNYERNDHIDREGSWVNSKSRAAVSNHGRNQVEKPSPRFDSVSTAENKSDRYWDGFRNGPVSSYQVRNSSFRSTNSTTSSANMQYSIYPLPAMSSNGVGPSGPAVPSVVMLYSYDQGISYSTPTESLEFGSLGPVHLSGVNEVPPQTDGSRVTGVVEQRHGSVHGDSRRSSPDQPSSPQVQRSVIRRNYQLKDEDFPPLPFPSEGRGGGGDKYHNKPSLSRAFLRTHS